MIRRRAFALALLAALACWSVLAAARKPWERLAGDEPTYLAMAESLAWDGDLAFGAADRARIEGAADPRRRAVILQRTDRGVAYSKPALYPALAAPFVRLAGRSGMWVANLLFLAAAGAVVGAAWRRSTGAAGARWMLLAAGAGGVVPAYLVWGMSDTLQLALAAAGGALSIAATRSAKGVGGDWLERPATAVAGGVCLGLLTALRLPNGLLAASVVAALVAVRRPRRAMVVGAAAAAALTAAFAVDWTLGGHPAPYRAERATFNAATGYPAGEGAERAMEQFEAGRATHHLGPRPGRSWRVSAYAALYFLIGRHTGALVYLPLFAVLAAAALAGGERAGRCLAAGALGLAAFYLVWMPGNYFGGEAMVGNRYLLPAYGLLAVAPAALPRRRWIAAALGVALAVGISAGTSSWRVGADAGSQSHAYAGLFRWLPYESTARSIEGRRDRYWSDELVRFVDPFAGVETHGFKLSSAGPPAELLVANDRRFGPLSFIVQGEGAALEVVYRDWHGERVLPLGPGHDGRARGVLMIETAPPWRRHPFWWRPDATGFGRVARIAVRSPDGGRAVAELRYLGAYRPVRKFWNRFVVAAPLPERATAGERSWLPVELRNTGRRPWTSRAEVPVHLAYRLTREGALRTRSGSLSELPGTTRRAEQVEAAVEVVWPVRPGRYRLEVDLLLGGTVWFGEIVGEPVAAGTVEVVATEAAAGSGEVSAEASGEGAPEGAGAGPR